MIEKLLDLVHQNLRLFQDRIAPAFVRHQMATVIEAHLLAFAARFTTPLEWAINKDREAPNHNFQESKIVKRYLY